MKLVLFHQYDQLLAKIREVARCCAMDSGICIPDLLFPLPTHKAELSRRRAGTRRVNTAASDLTIRKSSDALLLRCSDAEVGQDRASGLDRPSTRRA